MKKLNLIEHTHRRLNILTGEWILVSPHRTMRPWQGKLEKTIPENKSHYGLSKDYEVSSKELDLLVEAASTIEGIIGARMMGAGFGGCTTNLVEEAAVESFTDLIIDQYLHKAGKELKVHIGTITSGTERITETIPLYTI